MPSQDEMTPITEASITSGMLMTSSWVSWPEEQKRKESSATQKFLQEELKLELSEEKTLITHARSEAARFLGYEVTIQQEDNKRTNRNHRNWKGNNVPKHQRQDRIANTKGCIRDKM